MADYIETVFIAEEEIKDIGLNFPYYTYPQIQFSGYQDINSYNKDLIKLTNNLIKLQEKNNKFLLHITIGAAMEEAFDSELYTKYSYQWQQLLPQHIIDYLKQGGEVVHYIIAPNENFSSAKFKIPRFVKYTPEFKWSIDINNKKFTSQKYKYTVIIFNTMMPCIDKRNKVIIENAYKFDPSLNLDKYKQKEDDINFINKFYLLLDRVFQHISYNGGAVSCYSFAVFNEDTDYCVIMDYQMFPKIKNVFKKYNDFVLAEWRFFPSCYTMEIYEKCKIYNCDKSSISYINPDSNHNSGLSLSLKSGLSSTSFILQKSSDSSEFNI